MVTSNRDVGEAREKNQVVEDLKVKRVVVVKRTAAAKRRQKGKGLSKVLVSTDAAWFGSTRESNCSRGMGMSGGVAPACEHGPATPIPG